MASPNELPLALACGNIYKGLQALAKILNKVFG